MFMSVLDISIVNVAIATIQNEFGGTTQDVQWVLTAYTLMLGVVVPATGWLGDRFGFNRLYNLALLMFAAGSALCGLAWDLNSLVAFRILQAIPGGILPVVTLSILFKLVPRERIGAAMGLYGLGVVFAPAIGPSLGGYLVEYVDWRLIFYINVPIGILGAVAGALVLPSFPRRVGQSFDVLGFVTIAGGLFALLLALSKGEDWHWSSYRILGLFTLSALLLALFVVIELEVANPLLDIRIFRAGQFTLSMVLITILTVMLFGTLFYIPLYLQQAQGMGAFDSGLTLLPQALAMGVLMPIAGRAYDRIGPRWLVVIGLMITTVGAYRLHTLALDTPREHVMWLLVVLGVGLGVATMPIFTSGLTAVPVAQSNIASVFNNVVRNAAGALGIAVLTAILTIQQAQQLAGRAALLPRSTPLPLLNPGPPGTPTRVPEWPRPLLHLAPLGSPKWLPIPQTGPSGPPWFSVWALYNRIQQLVFVGAVDDLFLFATALGAVAVLVALFLPSRPTTPATQARPAPPAQVAAPTAAEVTADGRHPTPTTDGQTRTVSEEARTPSR
jgi:EmrB/QacA subfamily drug resistance transporter